MLSLLVVIVIAAIAVADQHALINDNQSEYTQQFAGSSVYRCQFSSQIQYRQFLQNASRFDLWHSDPHSLTIDVRIPAFQDESSSTAVPDECSLWINDLPSLIEREQQSTRSLAAAGFDTDAYFLEYHSHSDIVAFCKSVAEKYSKLVSRYLPSVAKTHEGRPLPVLHLTSPVAGADTKRQIWINGGIHAREWISSHVAMFLIKQLVTGYGQPDSAATRLLDKYEFVFAPHINPDGYEYSRTKNRMWRKNRRQNDDKSFGVDLNRNFDVDWAQGGSSRTPSSDTYHGPSVASEPEVAGLQQYILSNLTRPIIGIDLHAYGQLIMRPYGNKMTDHPTEERNRRMGDRMRDAVFAENGVRYTSQKSAGLYPVSGGFDDWMTEKRGLIGFTIELRDTGRYGFILPKEQILPTGREIWRGLPDFIEAFD